MFLIIFILFTNISFAKNVINSSNNNFVLDEQKLRNLIDNSNPNIESTNIYVEQSILDEKLFNRNYNFNLYGDINHNSSSNNWTVYDFSGINRETNLNIGLEKEFVNGMSAKAYYNNSNGNYYFYGRDSYNVNRNTFSLVYSLDLWKNFLGHKTSTNKLNLELNKKQKSLKSYIEKNNFYYSIRRLYWKIVIQERELIFYRKMIKQAEKNLKNIEKRYKTYVADDGDLFKARANVDFRKSNYENIRLNIEKDKQKLKYYIPELMDKNIIVNNFDLIGTFNTIMSCNRNIFINKTDSWVKLSTYDDFIKIMDKIIENEIKIISRDDDFDIKLNLGANFNGVDSKFNKSFKDLKGLDRNNYSVGLSISKNIGEDLEENKVKLSRMRYNIDKNNILLNMGSIYNTYENIMTSMFNNLDSLNKYRSNMEKRLESSQNKYNQGRLSLNDLIIDENSVVDANIQLIAMEGVIIDTVLQYLSIFDKTLCDFNLKF